MIGAYRGSVDVRGKALLLARNDELEMEEVLGKNHGKKISSAYLDEMHNLVLKSDHVGGSDHFEAPRTEMAAGMAPVFHLPLNPFLRLHHTPKTS